MARRKAWRDLTPAYRRRLERQGITARSHRSADLTVPRGHVSTRVVGAIDRGTLERILAQREGTLGEVTGRDLLARFTWPSWVPHTVENQQDGFTYSVDPVVAAALSRLPDPHTWRDVAFTPRGEDEPWTMVVDVKGRKRPVETIIPGGGGPGSGAKVVLDILTSLEEKENERRVKRRIESLFFTVRGTDEEV